MLEKQRLAREKAQGFRDFVDASPTREYCGTAYVSVAKLNYMLAYHAVRSAAEIFQAAGFAEIKERDSWATSLRPGGKYYLTRNGSSIIAFAIGMMWKPGNPIAMIGAHTDSPCLRIKPDSKQTSSGFMQVGVETYGGGIWHTWFDRDLGIAGRAMVRNGDGNFVQSLVMVDRPILCIPNLAIHLDRSKTFSPNPETELFPIAGLVAAELNRTGEKEGGRNADEKISELEKTSTKETDFAPLKALSERHHPYIVEIIAENAGVAVEDVVDFEIVLYDTQKSCFGGINNELIFSARLDNLEMTYCSIMGLIESLRDPSALNDEPSIRLVACFDNEEVGSLTAQGARSNLLPAIVKRLSVLPSHSKARSSHHEMEATLATAYEQTLSTSFLISADMAHSVHPNYAAKHESNHRPEMNKGTVIKINSDTHYATNSPGIVLLQEIARKAKPSNGSTDIGVPLQLFVVRNDSPCGSTIGPMLSAALGARTLDLGNPQLSMHSIRECGGVYDIEHAIRLFESFFQHYSDLEARIFVD
jgi:aspartyl aminopeptidase